MRPREYNTDTQEPIYLCAFDMKHHNLLVLEVDDSKTMISSSGSAPVSDSVSFISGFGLAASVAASGLMLLHRAVFVYMASSFNVVVSRYHGAQYAVNSTTGLAFALIHNQALAFFLFYLRLCIL